MFTGAPLSDATHLEINLPEITAGGIATVVIIGAGAMGRGIAQVIAEAGLRAILSDSDSGTLTRAMTGIAAAWDRAVAKGRLDKAFATAAHSNFATDGSLAAVREADLVIEAIVEKVEAKIDLLRELSPLLRPGAIIGSNTSSISITRLAAATDCADRVIGLHFFNPVPVLPLVEVVRGLLTSQDTVGRAISFARAIGKTPVEVNDFPGFVSNRVLLPMINEAIFCLAEGVASKESIDDIMKLGMAHPLGPLALADLIGLDVCLDILITLQRDLGEDKYRPAPTLRRLVAAGKLGRKSGEGFYLYPNHA
jgi:3-hydroxybutyryl-CoA dehydrogenase